MEEITFVEKNNNILLHLNGDLNTCRVMNVGEILRNLIDKCPRIIAVDCGMLYGIDPSSISQIIRCLAMARKNNIELVFYNLKPEVQVMFDLMKLNGLFTVMSQEIFDEEYGHYYC